jgi:hypothetical protein
MYQLTEAEVTRSNLNKKHRIASGAGNQTGYLPNKSELNRYRLFKVCTLLRVTVLHPLLFILVAIIRRTVILFHT